jgi:hypothetical protein
MNAFHPQPSPAPDAEPSVIAVLGPVEMGMRLAAGNPAARVSVFADTWAEVDRARGLVFQGGLDGRVAVHHRSAAGLSTRALRALRRPA